MIETTVSVYYCRNEAWLRFIASYYLEIELIVPITQPSISEELSYVEVAFVIYVC